jgi:hypothetical protein
MKPRILLRIAAIALLLHDAGHSSQILLWTKTDDPAKQEVIRQMTMKYFPFMGASRSMGDGFEGFIWAASIAMLFFVVVLWIVSGDNQNPLARKILIVTAVILAGWWIVELNYFFLFAAVNTFVVWLFILTALFQLRNRTEVRAAL